jgi:peptide/nickel transport system substrate-binding protein
VFPHHGINSAAGRSRLLAVLLAVPLAITACSGGGGSAAPSVSAAAPDDRPVKNGGTLTVALDADPDALDPASATTLVGRQVFVNMCEKLYDIDAKSTLLPELAAALPQLSADGKSATIKLRTGIKFNDGTVLDAASVKQTLDRNRTWAKSARKSDLAAVSKVTVVDPSTVQLTLSRPFAPLTAQLADRAGMILSPKALAAGDDNFATHPVCVGPFQYVSRTSGSQIVLDRAPNYYDAAKVKLDKLIFKIIVDPNVRVANLKSGDIQVGERIAAATVGSVQSAPDLRVVSGGGFGYFGMQVNIGNVKGATAKYGKVSTALGSSPQLREAFELSLDRNAINKTVFNGLYQPDCSPLPLDSHFRAPGFQCPPTDVAKAKQLVAQSGVKTPVPVTLTTPNDATDLKLAQVIQNMAKQAGFAVTVKTEEFVTTLDEGAAGKFDTLLTGWSGRVDPDGNLNNIINTGGANNYAGMSDPGIDGPLQQAAATTDVGQRTQLYSQVVQKAAELRGIIYLYHNKEYLGTRRDIAGIRFFEDGLPRFETAGYAQ